IREWLAALLRDIRSANEISRVELERETGSLDQEFAIVLDRRPKLSRQPLHHQEVCTPLVERPAGLVRLDERVTLRTREVVVAVFVVAAGELGECVRSRRKRWVLCVWNQAAAEFLRVV